MIDAQHLPTVKMDELSMGMSNDYEIAIEEGATLVLADNKGKEFTVPLAEIDERVKSNLSLMPANVAEILNEREFLDLVSFLLAQRQKVEPK